MLWIPWLVPKIQWCKLVLPTLVELYRSHSEYLVRNPVHSALQSCRTLYFVFFLSSNTLFNKVSDCLSAYVVVLYSIVSKWYSFFFFLFKSFVFTNIYYGIFMFFKATISFTSAVTKFKIFVFAWTLVLEIVGTHWLEKDTKYLTCLHKFFVRRKPILKDIFNS